MSNIQKRLQFNDKNIYHITSEEEYNKHLAEFIIENDLHIYGFDQNGEFKEYEEFYDDDPCILTEDDIYLEDGSINVQIFIDSDNGLIQGEYKIPGIYQFSYDYNNEDGYWESVIRTYYLTDDEVINDLVDLSSKINKYLYNIFNVNINNYG